MQNQNITKEQITSLSHLPISLACLALNTEIDTLKMLCREYGIKRWPYNARKEMNKALKSNTFISKETNGAKSNFFEFKCSKDGVGIPKKIEVKIQKRERKNLIQKKVPLNSEQKNFLPGFSELLKIFSNN